MDKSETQTTLNKLTAIMNDASLDETAQKALLREFIAAAWPSLPPWSRKDLKHALVEEEKKTPVGSGLLITFYDDEDGKNKVLLGQAGAHYTQKTEENTGERPELYTISGGFMNLNRVEGSAYIEECKGKAETPQEAAAREAEEEFRLADGSPLLKINPERLIACDATTINFPNGGIRVVMSFRLELTPEETQSVKAHLNKMRTDIDYRDACTAHTNNEDSGLPEICDLKAFTFEDVLDGTAELLHKDQLSLFAKAQEAITYSKPAYERMAKRAKHALL